jgi:hypothetical protein
MISAKIEMRQPARRLHAAARVLRDRGRGEASREEMEEFDYRSSTPSELRSFRQRAFLGAIGGYAALNPVIGFLRNQLLLEQIFLGTKGTSIDDALSIVGTDAGQRG